MLLPVLSTMSRFSTLRLLASSSSSSSLMSPSSNVSNSLLSKLFVSNSLLACSLLHTSTCLERARQATRARKRKVAVENKRKKEERMRRNPPPVPQRIVEALMAKGEWLPNTTRRTNEEMKSVAPDHELVFDTQLYCYPRLKFEDAIEQLRRHFHPQMRDRPDDFVNAFIEFDMRAIKRDRYMEDFSVMVPILNKFSDDMPAKAVMAFVEDSEGRKAALEAGAKEAGGQELIRALTKGKIDPVDFDHFVCHPELLISLKPLLGILRDKAPKVTSGTVGEDMRKLVRTFLMGQEVRVAKFEPTLGRPKEPDYGCCETVVGALSQDVNGIRENVDALLEALHERAPNREGGFITRVVLRLDDSPSYSHFSITHPLIYDQKLIDFEKEVQKMRGGL